MPLSGPGLPSVTVGEGSVGKWQEGLDSVRSCPDLKVWDSVFAISLLVVPPKYYSDMPTILHFSWFCLSLS
jgi:hypothetical protein